MIIFFGTRGARTKTSAVNESCSQCDSSDGLNLISYQRYVHVFWIPIFPVGMKHILVCPSCGAGWDIRSAEAKEIHPQHAKTPIWAFAGLIFIASLLALGFFSNRSDIKNTENYLAAPLVNDIYEYEAEKNSFSLLKVVAVTDDSVYIIQHRKAINLPSKLHKLVEMEGTDQELYYAEPEDINAISISDLPGLKEDGPIRKVLRK